MKDAEICLDSQFWHACAGGMVQMPLLNTKVFYFPQGHAEHACTTVDFATVPRIPPLVLCRVVAVKFLADLETDEVYAKIRLLPLGSNELDFDDDGVLALGSNGAENPEKPASFAKTLTQSDANNGGGFSVPRYCAETIFPRLDYSADPPVQTVMAKDVHGEVWKFRHIYRGTPRRHLLTTGWSTFVNQKKLVAGDSIVFLRADNGDLCVGIRRAKRGIGGGADCSSGWNSGSGNCVSPFGGFSMFLREDENKMMSNGSLGSGTGLGGRSKVKPEAVMEAAALAASGQPFEVVYYPRASTPEFCVKASSVKAALGIQWCSGMRFKMAFETEDSSRISWFMGTVACVQVADPIRWSNSPWRLLQVTWDEPDLLQNVKRVSPWLVELVSSMPVIYMSPFSPPRKKLRLPQHPDFLFDGHFPVPSFSGNPLGPSSPMRCLPDNAPAGIQGARHAQFGGSLSDLHLNNRLQSGLFPTSFQRFDPVSRFPKDVMSDVTNSSDNVSCLLTMGSSSHKSEKSVSVKKHQFLLFGKTISTEEQTTHSGSSDAVSQVLNSRSSSDGNAGKMKMYVDHSQSTVAQCGHPPRNSASTGFLWDNGFGNSELGLDTGHCKVFMESEDVGRTLNLSPLNSYEELYERLAHMFGIEKSEMLSKVLYRDAAGSVKRTGNEPFSEFRRTAKRLTILLDSGSSSNNNIGRTWFNELRNTDNGLDSSNKAGPLSIFA